MLLELCPKQDWVSFGVSSDVLARARVVWDMHSVRALAFSPERNMMILDYKQIKGMEIMRSYSQNLRCAMRFWCLLFRYMLLNSSPIMCFFGSSGVTAVEGMLMLAQEPIYVLDVRWM